MRREEHAPPLRTHKLGSRVQERRLPLLREGLFVSGYLLDQYNVGVNQRRGEGPFFADSREGSRGGERRNPLPERAFSFCPFSLCTSKEKMDTEQIP